MTTVTPVFTSPGYWLLALCLGLLSICPGQTRAEQAPHAAIVTVDGAIGPATTDYLNRSFADARDAGAEVIVLKIDTPGGLDASTRDIVQLILDSPVPVITYVHPAGGRAASAGTYILYASHLAAMSPSTTLGAATPVKLGGGMSPGGQRPEPEESETRERDESGNAEGGQREDAKAGQDAMERKVINDSVAFIRGLAQRHGRNADWAERAVRDAATLTAREALAENVIDIVAADIEQLLAQADGRTVAMAGGEQPVPAADLPTREYRPDWRNELLALITNPQVAYILLLIGIYGLIFEGYSPGAMVPGVVGVICLLLGLYAMQVLPVNYAGLALIIAGALLIVAEAFVPSFGVLGIGGVVALVFGSIMLMDTDVPGMAISNEFVGGIAFASSVIVLALIMVVGKNLRGPRKDASKALIGERATVTAITDDAYQVKVHGELWSAHSEHSLDKGQRVTVTDQQGLNLTVAPLSQIQGAES